MFTFPFYRQHDSMDCGPTCLRIVSKFYKKNVPVQYFREKAQIGKQGVNLLGISDAAESIGFRTQSVKLELDALEEVQLPCILHWNQKHFVVLYKVRKNKYYISDPAIGLVHYKKTEFIQHWVSTGKLEGVALTLEPSAIFFKSTLEEFDKKAGALNFSSIIKYILPFKKLFFQLFIGLCISTILQFILPFLTKSVVDTGINTANIHFIYVILIAQIALLAGRLVVDFVRGWIMLHISTRVNISILTDFLIKLTKLPVSFFDSKKTGDILQRMNDHSRIESFLTGSSLGVLFSLINLVIFSIMLIVFNSTIFTVVIIANIINALWLLVWLRRKKKLDGRRFQINSQKQTIAIQMVQGMQEMKLYGCEKSVRWSWERLQARAFKLNAKGLAISQWQSTGAFFINEGKNIVVTFLSAKAVIDGQMTFGTMLAVQYMIGQINGPISQLIGFIETLQYAKISMDRLNEIHTLEDEEPEHKKLSSTLPPYFTKQLVGGTGDMETMEVNHVTTGKDDFGNFDPQIPAHFGTNGYHDENNSPSAIYFKNLTFTYAGAGNEPVLKDINLTIPLGKTTAIVGTSGSGKTTLLKLFLKYYEPQKGEIKLDATSLGSISHKTWRSHCGSVMQESFVFSNTIARNIAVGDEEIDIDRLYNAARMANILEFIVGLPLGFNTKIGAEGMGISTGQRQRVLIARAVYRDPEFILFDEATNSLDANNEKIIMKNLKVFFRHKTVIVVAHRLSTVKNADQIILLNKGVVEERGTHDELINLKGAYYTLIKNQLELGN
jgi:ATP-binding cassette subfamily B protein